jgi:hypothetical protein
VGPLAVPEGTQSGQNVGSGMIPGTRSEG